jgi:Tol biopolymer transport system component
MKQNIFIICVFLLAAAGCKENPTEPEPIKQKILKTGEVVFFSSDRDGEATNIFMMTPEGEIIKKITNYEEGKFVPTAVSPDSNQLLFYRAAPGLSIDDGIEVYIYKIREDTIIGPVTYGHPGNFSPDGRRFVFHRHTFIPNGSYESIYLYDLTDGSEQKLTEDGKTSFYAQISPDGKSICYQSASFLDTLHCWQIHLMDVDGTNIIDLTPAINGYYAGYPVFSPDGQSVFFHYNERTSWYDICKINIHTMEKEYITYNHVGGTSYSFMNPNVSKDGSRIFFYSYPNDYQEPYPVDVYSINMDRTYLKNISNDDYWDSHPVFGTVSYFTYE